MTDVAFGGSGWGGSERPALRRCVAGDLDEFASEYWGARALLSHGPDLPAPYDDLFSLDAVDELLSRRGLRTPFIRIAKNGSVVGDNQFTGPAGVGAEIGDQVRDDKVAALFASGHTVVLQALHRTWPPLVDFATQLFADAGHPVQINAYITPAESQGFSAHYDVHDVFVLQVAGEKHWTVHEPVHPDPLRNQPWNDHAQAVAAAARDNTPVVDEVLRPGDALYVPRGFLHSAKALGGVSAHLTIGLHTLTRYLVVQELVAQAANEPALRKAFPLGFDPGNPDHLREILPEVIELLTATLTSTAAAVSPDPTTPANTTAPAATAAPADTTAPAEVPARAEAAGSAEATGPADAVDKLADRLRRRTWSGNRPAPLAPLAHAASIASLAVGTTVRLRPGLRCRLVPGDPVTLQLPDRAITFPASTTEALAALTAGADCKVGTLPALDAEDQLVLVRRLLTEAVLIATP